MKQSSNEEKIRVKPLTGEIAESVWDDEDGKVKPKDKDLQHTIFNDVEINFN